MVCYDIVYCLYYISILNLYLYIDLYVYLYIYLSIIIYIYISMYIYICLCIYGNGTLKLAGNKLTKVLSAYISRRFNLSKSSDVNPMMCSPEHLTRVCHLVEISCSITGLTYF